MSNTSVEEQINSLKNLSTALGVLDKLPQHLVKDAMNNVIPSVIFALQQQEALVKALEDVRTCLILANGGFGGKVIDWDDVLKNIDQALAPFQEKG